MPKVFLKAESKSFLKQCEHLFPDGFPVTAATPEREMDWYWKTSLLGKFKFALINFIRHKKWIWLNPNADPPFFILDSYALLFPQNQAVLKLLKNHYWNGIIPKWVDPTNPLKNSIKILASEVESLIAD